MAGVTGVKRRIVRPSKLEERFAPGFLDRLDKRFRAAQLAALYMQEVVTALGGEDHVTPQQRVLIERAAWAHRRLQEMEAEYAGGQGLDTTEWATLTGALTSCLRLLGLQRRAKPLPTLREYLAESPPPSQLTAPSTNTGPAPEAAAADEGTPP